MMLGLPPPVRAAQAFVRRRLASARAAPAARPHRSSLGRVRPSAAPAAFGSASQPARQISWWSGSTDNDVTFNLGFVAIRTTEGALRQWSRFLVYGSAGLAVFVFTTSDIDRVRVIVLVRCLATSK